MRRKVGGARFGLFKFDNGDERELCIRLKNEFPQSEQVPKKKLPNPEKALPKVLGLGLPDPAIKQLANKVPPQFKDTTPKGKGKGKGWKGSNGEMAKEARDSGGRELRRSEKEKESCSYQCTYFEIIECNLRPTSLRKEALALKNN